MEFLHKVRAFFQRCGKWLGRALDTHPVIFTCVTAFLVTLVIESVSRFSPLKAVAFMFVHPVNFLANYFIVLSTVSLAHLFKKRVFFLTLLSSVWMGLGIANGAVLANRVTPFGAIDLMVLPSVFTIFTQYLEIWEIVLIVVAFLLAVAGLVVLFIKTGKVKPSYRVAAIFISASVLLGVGTYSLTVVGHREERAATFSNIANAYKTYGFVYCFTTGAADMGISEPETYSRASVNWLLGNIHENTDSSLRPNVIMVQLESFFDVSHLTNLTVEADPTPVFTRLKEQCTSGYLTVPSIGAGTANTEFEVLSGMSLDFFGMGEYPYKTILKEEACPSICRDLATLGYTSTAIHNNTATFYGRNEVFAQLGFDRFDSIEYMPHIEYNPIGWAKDAALTEEILKALDSTEGQDFIFTITVQGHGKYQRGVDSVDMESLGITWEDDTDDQDAFAYYTSQLSETDTFIGELLDALTRRNEPTVVVLYGDHLPSFSIGAEQLENGDIFQTEYVIWSNFAMEARDEDVEAYQLSAQVLEDLGLNPGLLTKYHQQMWDTPDYLDGLQLLEYDMLYGEYYCFGGANPYEATDLKLGVVPITLSSYEYDPETDLLTVHGQNFTAWSVLTLDGEELETTFDEETGDLTATVEELEAGEYAGAVLTVRQVTALGVDLSESVGIKIE